LQILIDTLLNWLYGPLAFAYDFVAWLVSAGYWKGWVLSVLSKIEGQRVLEIGYGPGHLQLAALENQINIYGIDASIQMARMAKKRLEISGQPGKLIIGKAQALPYPTDSFSQVISTFPSEYCIQPETLAEVSRILDSDGIWIILNSAKLEFPRFIRRAATSLERFTSPPRGFASTMTAHLEQAKFNVEWKSQLFRNSILYYVYAKPCQDQN